MGTAHPELRKPDQKRVLSQISSVVGGRCGWRAARHRRDTVGTRRGPESVTSVPPKLRIPSSRQEGRHRPLRAQSFPVWGHRSWGAEESRTQKMSWDQGQGLGGAGRTGGRRVRSGDKEAGEGEEGEGRVDMMTARCGGRCGPEGPEQPRGREGCVGWGGGGSGARGGGGGSRHLGGPLPSPLPGEAAHDACVVPGGKRSGGLTKCPHQAERRCRVEVERDRRGADLAGRQMGTARGRAPCALLTGALPAP